MFRRALIVAAAVVVLAAGEAPIGSALLETWRELPGATVKQLTDAAAWPAQPDEQILIDRLELPENQPPEFATRIRCRLHAPADGAYTLLIASDEQSELWLAADGDPAHAVKVAEVPEWSLARDFTMHPGQRSSAVALTAARPAYLEVRHKDGGGDNHLCVGWVRPDGVTEAPIPGSRLSPVAAAPPAPARATASVPTVPGEHAIEFLIEVRAERFTLPVTLLLPPQAATAPVPLLVYLAPDQAGGPDVATLVLESAKARGWAVFAPRCPEGRRWTQRSLIAAVAAALDQVAQAIPFDPGRLYASGHGSGGTLLWHLVLALPPRVFAALAPINGHEVREAALVQHLAGTPILISTGWKDGFATECANRMKNALKDLAPPPRVDYLALGVEAPAAVYARAEFWQWLGQWSQTPVSAPPAKSPPAKLPVQLAVAALSAVALIIALVWLWRLGVRRPVA